MSLERSAMEPLDLMENPDVDAIALRVPGSL